MSNPSESNIEVPDRSSRSASEKSCSFTTARLKKPSSHHERPCSANKCNSDCILQDLGKTKEKNRPKSCGAENVPKENLSAKLRENVPSTENDAWFVALDTKKRSNRSMSKSSAKGSESGKKVGSKPGTANTRNSSSGIPLPKKSAVSSKVSNSSRPSSKSKIQRSISSDIKNPSATARRNLELQFSLKKKRFDTMKKDLIEKQKPILDVYQNLTQLKKKLEDVGKTVNLEEIKFIDCNVTKTLPPKRNEDKEKTEFEMEIVKTMTDTINFIPKPLAELCRNLMTKRSNLIEVLSKHINEEIDSSDLQRKVENMKQESTQLEKKIEQAAAEQETRIQELVQKWQDIVDGREITMQPPPPPPPSTMPPERFHEMHRKIKKQDHEIKELKQKIEELQNTLKDRPEKSDLLKAEEQIKNMTTQIKEMDGLLIAEKKNATVGAEAERQLKLLRARMKEVELRKHDAEKQISTLQKTIKQKEEAMKSAEKAWEAERQELVKINSQDKQLLNKLTKDRGFLETRVKTLAEIVDENEKAMKEMENRCEEEVKKAQQQLEEERTLRESMEKKYEYMKQEFFKLEVTNQQAIDLVVTRKEGRGEEREAELYTELLATRVALKAAEDKVKNYAREKLRFIDTIERLSCNSENNMESLAASLVHKEEEITHLEKKIEQYEEVVRNQKIEIANLNASIANMEERLVVTSHGEQYPTKDLSSNELGYIIDENKIKMDEILKKSLDYEQKIIRYEHDIEMQQKQLYEMDNLLKVRDGLIGMLKAKKDELFIENESLTKYANEIRDALMETKQELIVKHEEIQQLFSQLDQKSKMLIKQDKKIKDLKDTLSSTNEKRYKLQDTLGAMEKELQSTKAHVNRMSSEIQARTKPKFF